MTTSDPKPQQTAEERAAELLSNIVALRQSAAFAYFLQNCVQSDRDDAESKLHDLKIGAVERDHAAHVSEALRKVLDWVDFQHNRLVAARESE